MNHIYILADATAPAQGGQETQGTFGDQTQKGTQQPESKPQGGDDKDPNGGGFGSTLLWIGIFFFIIYFLIIRPQKKQQKELKDRQDGLKSGDKVVTAGGIFGIVREVKEQTVRLEIAPNTVIKVAKSSIVQTVAKDGTAEAKK